MMRTERAYPLRVKSAVLTVGLLLPVFPGEPTFSGLVGMSQRCQTQTPLHSITSSAQTSRVADAAATLPESKRTSTMMAEMASQILAGAAKGERDPATLKIAALSALVECSHYSHDISPERRAV